MRIFFLIVGTACLAACGGAGPQSAGSAAPAAGGGGVGGAQGSSSHSFVDPSEAKTYTAIGATHSYQYQTSDQTTSQSAQLYQGNSTTPRAGGITVAFDPRDAIYTLTIQDANAGVGIDSRFQDPAHRTDFGGAVEPQFGTAQLSSPEMNYLESGSSSNVFVGAGPDIEVFLVDGEDSGSYDVTTFFFQTPGTETSFVTFGGFVRNNIVLTRVEIPDEEQVPGGPDSFVEQSYELERGGFAYGELTSNSAVPRTGSGTFDGAMIASMVFNNLIDQDAGAPTYFQWIEGRAATEVNFGANSFSIDLSGTTFAPQFDMNTTRAFTIAGGASFDASGSGRIDLVGSGGFLGDFNSASLVNPDGTRFDLNIAGSSVDGAFFGPAAEELGGSFRIVGGVPDERIDILGTFVGKK